MILGHYDDGETKDVDNSSWKLKVQIKVVDKDISKSLSTKELYRKKESTYNFEKVNFHQLGLNIYIIL